MKSKMFKLTLTNRKAIAGYLFTLPLTVGFITLFAVPVLQSIIFSFNNLKASSQGLALNFVGWENYRTALFVDPDYIRSIVSSLSTWAVNFPMIIIFSFFIANVLNQQFKGRTVARAIFFLPVIITSGVILIIQNDQFMGIARGAVNGSSSSMDSLQLVTTIVDTLKLPIQFTSYVQGAVDRVYDIVVSSGVQILIFLAGLQTISASLYEAAGIDGATAWEKFWKITFPMISPLILVNSVYTVIDSLSGLQNPIINTIYQVAFRSADFGYSAAMSWLYFLIIIVVVGITILIISRYVYYEND